MSTGTRSKNSDFTLPIIESATGRRPGLSHIEQYIDTRRIEIKRKRPNSARAIATVGKSWACCAQRFAMWRSSAAPDGFKLYREGTDEIFSEGVNGNCKPHDRALH